MGKEGGEEENYMRESYTANKTKASLLTGTWCMYEQCLTYTCSNFNLTSKGTKVNLSGKGTKVNLTSKCTKVNLTSKGTKVKASNTSVSVSQRHWFLSHYFNHILP